MTIPTREEMIDAIWGEVAAFTDRKLVFPAKVIGLLADARLENAELNSKLEEAKKIIADLPDHSLLDAEIFLVNNLRAEVAGLKEKLAEAESHRREMVKIISSEHEAERLSVQRFRDDCKHGSAALAEERAVTIARILDIVNPPHSQEKGEKGC
jgi:hypothetical protein